MATAAMGKASERARVRVRMGHCWHAIVSVASALRMSKWCLTRPSYGLRKVLDMPSFLVPKLLMPKTDVPSPSKFNVPAHPSPKPAALPSLSAPEFKVPDAALKFEMPKVDIPSFSMPKFDIPTMPTFALPRWTC